jgi:broad specificity phosphatase PhoE
LSAAEEPGRGARSAASRAPDRRGPAVPDAIADLTEGRDGRCEIVLVRHAQTEWSRDGRHTGRSDIPLTAEGRRVAAGELAQRLRGRRFDLVLVSPSLRARETCELCGLAAESQVREDLLEWDYGEYEGLRTAEIRSRRPSWLLWREGCPGGESAADLGVRADRVIAELVALGGDAAVFSHGHMLRVIGARWIGLGPEQGARLALSTAATCELGRERERAVIARWNETCNA